jgi:hypothetical protein
MLTEITAFTYRTAHRTDLADLADLTDLTDRRHEDAHDVRISLICDLNALRAMKSTFVMRSVLSESVPYKNK